MKNDLAALRLEPGLVGEQCFKIGQGQVGHAVQRDKSVPKRNFPLFLDGFAVGQIKFENRVVVAHGKPAAIVFPLILISERFGHLLQRHVVSATVVQHRHGGVPRPGAADAVRTGRFFLLPIAFRDVFVQDVRSRRRLLPASADGQRQHRRPEALQQTVLV